MPDIQITAQTNPLLMEKNKFAELVGLSPDVIRGWIDKDLLPTYKIGRHRLINLALLQQELLGD
ncbi:MAG: DNA-binding protein [Candidatus Pacearchaeota archaeon]|nr:DNA-binding protein [Candidatus Pacearchaeota archaeon]